MRHVVVRHGDLTSVRDVVLMRLVLTLCYSNSLPLDDNVLTILL